MEGLAIGRPRVGFGVGVIAAAFAFALASPASALGSLANVSGPSFFYTASNGEANHVSVSLTSRVFTVTDTGAVIDSGPGCTSVTAHTVTCTTDPGWSDLNFSVFAGDGDDDVVVTDSPLGNGITNTITGGAGADQLTGGPGGDQIEGEDGDDTINGGGGDDLLIGGLGADALSGGQGEDLVTYSARNAGVTVTIDGNPDDGNADDGSPGQRDNVATDVENLQGSAADDTLTGSSGDNSLYGYSGNDTLNGAAGNDTLNESGSAGDDTLNGGDGDDALTGGGGADALNGGAGVDTVDYSDHDYMPPPVTVDLDGVADDGFAGENDNAGADVENIIGSPFADVLTGNASDNFLLGGGGNDTLSGLGGDDSLLGDQQFGILTGGGADDTLNGGAGDDLLDGGIGADLVNGGSGSDLADYSARVNPVTVELDGTANDGEAGEDDNVATDVERVSGGSGDDTLVGNAQPNLLYGGDGDDLLDGGLGADTLIGGDGLGDAADYSSRVSPVTVSLDGTATSGQVGENDTIATDVEDAIGGSAADTFVGSDGDNSFDGGPGADTFTGGAGFDAVDYSSRSQPVSVSFDGTANDGAAGESDNVAAGMEDAFGGSGDDHFTGNEASNLFAGGAGADVLDGAGGDDFLIGQSGADSLTGGPGFDTLDGGDDNDSIQSRDGVADDVFCGFGTDGVVADLTDSTFDCETVHRGPPLVTTGAASELTQATVTLSGTVNPAGQGATVYVQIGPTTAYGTQSSGLALPAAVADYGITSKWSNLQPGTTYHYRFLATNADGTTYGADQAFTTAGTVSGADVGVTISDAPDPVTVGKQITYALTVTNNGPGSAAAVTVRDPLPPRLVLVSASASQGTCTNAAPVRCDLGSLAGGASATVKIVARPKATGKLSNTATVSSTTPDLVTTNNSALATTTVRGPPCVVPNVKRKTLAAAKKAIVRAHCTLGRVRIAHSSTVRRGRVIAQRPAPRARLRNGGKVNLVVSRGRHRR